MKTRSWGLVALALCAGLAVWASGGAEGGTPALLQGEITFLDGAVTVDGKEARIGLAVTGGATIQTAAAAVCEITFGAQNIIQIQGNTTAVLELGTRRPALSLETGSVAAVMNKLNALSRRGGFTVKTPSAVAGVRGTVFFVKVEDASNTYVCACYGELGVNPASGRQVSLAATRHMARRFSRDGSKARVTPAGLLYHDDQSMGALASKIGYTVPWGQGSYGSSNSGSSGY